MIEYITITKTLFDRMLAEVDSQELVDVFKTSAEFSNEIGKLRGLTKPLNAKGHWDARGVWHEDND